MDSNSQYLIEIYAQHVDGLFKTKPVDIMVRTSQPLVNMLIVNLTAYQFVELNQIILIWSFEATELITTLNINQFLSYELRYWPKDDFHNANILEINGPACNFTLKNSNAFASNQHFVYMFQLRGRTNSGGWSPYTSPVESIRVANF